MSTHVMLVPSLACPASCSYCFGPHAGGKSMRRETLEAVVGWQEALGDNDRLEITFHGGEPLVPGARFYRMTLPLLREGFANRPARFAMQSNLWLLTDELCELFREFGVSIGSSLDGPEEINDAQRGRGYFRRTMNGIERARAHGIDVGCICTFTAQSVDRAEEIFDFFVSEGLNFSVHAALPSLRHPEANGWSLSPEAHGELLVDLLERYLVNLSRVRISTLDSMCRSVSAGRGGICTFGDCLGDYLAVGPEGSIYPCQRFAGMPEYALGNVDTCPSHDELAASPVWRVFEERQNRIAEDCGDCSYIAFCRGGCPYNALASNGGLERNRRDPHCESYKRVFDHISERALEEVFVKENLDEVVEHPDPEHGLLRRGRLLSLMKDGPHPYDIAQHARRILAAVALAATGSPAETARCFERLGLTARPERTEAAMAALHSRLVSPVSGLNNLYLNVTFACNLRCSHCYAEAGPLRAGALAITDLTRTCREAAQLGFRHAVITGGEPLVHPEPNALLDALAALREEAKPLLTVLRTSLAVLLDEAILGRLSRSTDQVVVSLDGDRETHDARRGEGTYELTVANLRALVALGGDTDISLATVLPLAQANGASGESVRVLTKELGIPRTRFRPLLPLGRAIDSQLEIVPETIWRHLDPGEMVAYGFSPTSSCGMGQNLYVEPDGAAYPCYAWHGEDWHLGSIKEHGGLAALVSSTAFRSLNEHTVSTRRRCRDCPLRYLCGGACRAWSSQPAQAQTDLDAPPLDCSPLHERARSLLVIALEHVGIADERWRSVGLPLPKSPPAVKH